MMTLLVLLSQLKYHVLMMTANFVDLMIVDTDTVSFLFTIFPALRWIVALALVALVPLAVFAWRLDPFRVRRLTCARAGARLRSAGSPSWKCNFRMQPFEAFYGGNLVSVLRALRRRRRFRTDDARLHAIRSPFAADRLKPATATLASRPPSRRTSS